MAPDRLFDIRTSTAAFSFHAAHNFLSVGGKATYLPASCQQLKGGDPVSHSFIRNADTRTWTSAYEVRA